VLFTDMVGATETAVALGDRRWKELLESYYALVRRQLQRFRGHEVDTAGDGFLSTFDGPGRAIGCAVAISQAMPRILGSVSADGRLLAFVLSVADGTDLWTVPLRGDPSPRQYLANGFQHGHPALSPDGRWMAYDSDESGRVEVYVQSFPDPTAARRQVSSGGGSEPLWTRGGRELVFRRGDSAMAVTVEPGSGAVSTPAVLFAGPYDSRSNWFAPRSYDATPDGQRFLLLKWPAGDVRRRVLVTTHWFDELRARVAGQAGP